MQRARLLAAAWLLALGACANTSPAPPVSGFGAQPTLPAPQARLFPMVNIAPAIGWPEGGSPQSAPGTQVTAFARDLDHPRWLYVLPNGDVLVAETNKPPQMEGGTGFTAWVMGLVMKRAGAGVASANRIILLRDTDGDGVADVRSVLLAGLNSPFGMVLVGNSLYVADTDAVRRFVYVPGDMHLALPGVRVVDLPAGPINLKKATGTSHVVKQGRRVFS